MRNQKYVIINSLIALFVITMAVCFLVFLPINKPGGVILYIIINVLSIGALVFFTFLMSAKPTTPSALILISAATYLFQFSPLIIFFTASDTFVNTSLIMVPIALIFIFVISYLVVVFLFTHFNKVALQADEAIRGVQKEVENEDTYYDADGNFKGLNK